MSNNSQLQLHYTTLQLWLHNTTLHPAVVGDVKDQIATATIATSQKKNNSNHLWVNQWIRSAICASQQPTSPIGVLFWNFRHRLVRYYWSTGICSISKVQHIIPSGKTNIQRRPLVTSTFWSSIIPMRGSRCDPFTSWSHQPCQIAWGEAIFWWFENKKNRDFCCTSYVFTLVNVQGEGFWLDFVTTECYRPGDHTMPAYKMKRKTSRMWPRDLVEFVGMQWNVLGSTRRFNRIYWAEMGGVWNDPPTPKRLDPQISSNRRRHTLRHIHITRSA